MKKPLLPLLALSLLSTSLVGCNKTKEEFKPLKVELSVKMDAGLNSNATDYDLKFKYDDSFFLKDAKEYDKELSELSFGCSLASKTAIKGDNFFNKAGYKDTATYSYGNATTEDGCAYIISHKSVDKYELFAISFRGFDYGKEWSNNLKIGKSGNHEGFMNCATTAYNDLQTYISSYRNKRPLKLWINGYSRGGGISNVLSSIILQDKKTDIKQEDMYVYTFESPRGLNKENAIKYENVHSIINSADLITNIAPEKYELYRCGNDIDIYDPEVNKIVRDLDRDIYIPEFNSTSNYSNDQELVNYLINYLVDNKKVDDTHSMNDRNHYVDNYQDGLSYFVGLLFALKDTTRNRMINSLKNMGASALTMISDETGVQLADFFKSYLKSDSISYDETKLVSSCAVICKAFKAFGTPLTSFFIGSDTNMTRILDMHYPESTYSLLLNSHK